MYCRFTINRLIINTYVSLMYELKQTERYLRVNLLGPGPRLMKKEFNRLGRRHCFEAQYLTVCSTVPQPNAPPRGTHLLFTEVSNVPVVTAVTLVTTAGCHGYACSLAAVVTVARQVCSCLRTCLILYSNIISQLDATMLILSIISIRSTCFRR